MKTINICCEGSSICNLAALKVMQGQLKSLPEENYIKLRDQILKLGFSFPFFVWGSKSGPFYILDGTQRYLTLVRMRNEEGYTIPENLPIVHVEATDEREAAKKILSAAAQYGEVNPDGLKNFMTRFEITMQEISTEFRFPEIDFPSFELTFFPEKKTVSFEAADQWKEMPEFEQEDKEPFRSVIIHFFDQDGIDTFAKLTGQTITDKTKMLWYPRIIIEKAADKRYGKPKP